MEVQNGRWLFNDAIETTLLTPRLRRTALLTAIIAFALVSLVLGIPLLFLITFSLILLWAFAFLFAHWLLRPLRLEVIASPEVLEGQPNLLRFRLVNEGRLPRFLVEAWITLPSEAETDRPPHLVFGSASRQQLAEADLTLRFRRRGLYAIETAELWGQDPFGLFIVRRTVKLDTTILVYPNPKPLALMPQGAEQVPKWEETAKTLWLPTPTGVEAWGVRAYQPGDPLRFIHWKMTAHRGDLFVRHMLPALREGGFLLLDRHPNAHNAWDAGRGVQDKGRNRGETTLDELVRVAAFLLREWLQGGYQVHFWVPPDPPLVVTGKDWHTVWRLLALLSPQPYTLPADFAGQGAGVILTTPLSPFLAQFEQARQAGWTVWQLPWHLDGTKDAGRGTEVGR
ncbi:MAG: hypothetical protein HZLCBSQH_000106 [Candidatus Fervidibacterota bacterium]